jgi:prephenate dehydrogenase
MDTVAIVGVGLIGGSFALALKKAGFAGRIIGVSSPATVRKALDRGVIDEAADLEPALARAGLVYLSHSISRILELIPLTDALVRPGALITDAGSTKERIVRLALESVRRGVFLGGHPMAGRESRGVAAADAGLFRGHTYFLTPLNAGDLDLPPVRAFTDWLARIGAVPCPIAAGRHDEIVALTSHLPQLLSTALASTVAARLDPALARTAAGPALIDSTRLALSPYEIWRDILATNRESVDAALAACISNLVGFRERLDSLDADFDAASAFARALRGSP